MPDALALFYDEFFQEILRSADAEGHWAEDAFFQLFCDHLVEAGVLETHDRTRYSATGMRIDGYGGDPSTTEGTLTLIVAEFSQSSSIETLTATSMDGIFRRTTNFLKKSLQTSFRNDLDETTAGFGVASTIADSWRIVHSVRVLLITNKVLSSRVDGHDSGEVDGRPVSYSVWDIGRLQRFVLSGRSREDMIVDLHDHGGPVPALQAHLNGANYEAYLMVLPGTQLASIYGKWGARLLEQNVRVFLQAKGNVNKGIRNTLENDADMFLAYNNGITATAEEVVTKQERNNLVVTAVKNLQIVNGGQTTASIYAASHRKDVDLSRAFVQMKLSVIPPAQAEEVVPKISEYANSQNKVNAADFFANHPFHLRIKDLSEKIFAPSQDGSFRESKWFYERARGQYQDARSRLTTAGQKKFELEYPKNQVITKTDLAKFLSTWEGLPHLVSTGAQKNFAKFASRVGKAWSENSDKFNETFFKDAIAMAIVFRTTEKLVSAQSWYDGSYRPNIVTYAIAKLAGDIKGQGKGIDLSLVWNAQQVPTVLAESLVLSAELMREIIIAPPHLAVKNVTEWAKKDACWQRAEALRIQWPAALDSMMIGFDEISRRQSDGVREQRVLTGIEAQTTVVNAGHEVWGQVRAWAIEHRVLSVRELATLEIVSRPNVLATERQSILIMEALRKARQEGCPFGPI